MSFMAPAAAAVTASSVGVIQLPQLLRSVANWILLVVAYANSTYPIAPGVWLTVAETPSLPRPPSPTGQFTDGPLPTFCCHSGLDRKSTRLNSSHSQISYAVFCLKKKKNINQK